MPVSTFLSFLKCCSTLGLWSKWSKTLKKTCFFIFLFFLLTFREIPTTDTILCCKNREIRHSFSATACRNQKHRQVINRFYDGTVSIIVLILDPKPLRFLVKILQKRVPAEARVRAGCNFLISSWIFLTLVKHSPP